MKYTSIGGQAVMEGVMMRSSKSMAMSVRRSNGTIEIEKIPLSQAKWRKIVAKIPLARGCVSFFESMVQGMKLTMRSAEMYGEDACESEEPSRFEKWLSKTLHIKLETVAVVIGVILGLSLSVGVFMLLPAFVGELIFYSKETARIVGSFDWVTLFKNLTEGVIRIALFLSYLKIVTLMKDIKRLFMYHGAEHKTISCYESGQELTVENARKFSTLHPRCGTSFLLIVMVISILVLSVTDILFGFTGILTFAMRCLRILCRLLMFPVISGISYEVLKGLAKSCSKTAKILRAPGMALQHLTTSEPDDEMLEVAITSFKTVIAMDEGKDTESVDSPESEAPVPEDAP